MTTDGQRDKATEQVRRTRTEAEQVDDQSDEARLSGKLSEDDLGTPGPPFSRRAPFLVGLLGGLGLLTAYGIFGIIESLSAVLLEVVVAFFIAAGLDPIVDWLQRRGLKRVYAVLIVVLAVLVAIALFLVAIVPVITDQVAAIGDKLPGWFDDAKQNGRVQDLDDKYQVLEKVQDYVADGSFLKGVFGGVVGVGLKVLGLLANAFVVLVLTLYFLSGFDKTKTALYQLAPASRRERVTKLGDRVIRGIGAYVSGAFVVALAAGGSSFVFLLVVGLGSYAVALAFVVAILDVIPLIGATIGAVVVVLIGFATDPKIGLACIIFYVIYQQVENYVVYPRVMSRSVDIPGVVTVIAALVGAALLGVVGALLAIPTAAAVLLITREVLIRQQDQR